MAFCDYCKCDTCVFGDERLTHAKTSNDDWVCDVCYMYDLCTASGPKRNKNGPCENLDCMHRPTLLSGWIK